jgi:Tol biopolymer transport system component
MPDNRHAVAVLRSNAAPKGGLWMADIRTGEATPLSLGLLAQTSASVSPDGSRVVFTAGGSDSDLMEMPLDGSPPRDVLASAANETYAAWIPQTSRFVYVTNKSGASELRVRSQTEHDDRVVLTSRNLFPGNTFGMPVASPDGQRVAFHIWGIGSPASVWIAPMQGGAPTKVSPDQAGQLAPEWSPDGRWLACLQLDAGVFRLAVLRVGAAESSRIVSERAQDVVGAPAWSPDGKWLAYVAQRQVHLVTPDGKTHRTLAAMRTETVAWSRDNSTLYTVGYTDRGAREIVTLDVSTGDVHVLHTITTPGLSVETRITPGQRFTIAADGKSFLASVLRSRMDLWILDDFTSPKGRLDRLFRR